MASDDEGRYRPAGAPRGLPNVEVLELLNVETTAALARQRDDLAALAARALVLVGYAGALSAFLATRHVRLGPAIAAYACYVGTAAFGLYGYLLDSSWAVTPGMAELEYSKADVLRNLVEQRLRTYGVNSGILGRKVWLMTTSLAFLVAGIVAMVVALLLAPQHH